MITEIGEKCVFNHVIREVLSCKKDTYVCINIVGDSENSKEESCAKRISESLRTNPRP